jgi:hypothetical protein
LKSTVDLQRVICQDERPSHVRAQRGVGGSRYARKGVVEDLPPPRLPCGCSTYAGACTSGPVGAGPACVTGTPLASGGSASSDGTPRRIGSFFTMIE